MEIGFQLIYLLSKLETVSKIKQEKVLIKTLMIGGVSERTTQQSMLEYTFSPVRKRQIEDKTICSIKKLEDKTIKNKSTTPELHRGKSGSLNSRPYAG